jgi:hypothetical protein
MGISITFFIQKIRDFTAKPILHFPTCGLSNKECIISHTAGFLRNLRGINVGARAFVALSSANYPCNLIQLHYT